MADTLPDDPEAVADDHGNGDQHDDIAALLAILDAGIAADKEPVVVLSASFKAKAVSLLAKHLKIKDRTTPALRKTAVLFSHVFAARKQQLAVMTATTVPSGALQMLPPLPVPPPAGAPLRLPPSLQAAAAAAAHALPGAWSQQQVQDYNDLRSKVATMVKADLVVHHQTLKCYMCSAKLDPATDLNNKSIETLRSQLLLSLDQLRRYYEAHPVDSVDTTAGTTLTVDTKMNIMYRFLVITMYNDSVRTSLLALGQRRSAAEQDAKQAGDKHPVIVGITKTFNDPNWRPNAGMVRCVATGWLSPVLTLYCWS